MGELPANLADLDGAIYDSAGREIDVWGGMIGDEPAAIVQVGSLGGARPVAMPRPGRRVDGQGQSGATGGQPWLTTW